MRTNSRRPSIVGLIAALALAACQSTPAAPPTQTPVNPKDNFATPGAPTPFLPTMTPVPSPTVRPTATAVPPTVTVAVPTLAPTKGATPTPTPVIVNGQPKMWWVDQMVKQADGSFMAPEAVRQAIREMAVEYFDLISALNGKDSRAVAQSTVRTEDDLAVRYFIGDLRKVILSEKPPQVSVLVAGTQGVLDVRGFSPDGLTAFYTFSTKSAKYDVYDTTNWTIVSRVTAPSDLDEIWAIRFDHTDGRWKMERLVGQFQK